jgi:hypothetical protein
VSRLDAARHYYRLEAEIFFSDRFSIHGTQQIRQAAGLHTGRANRGERRLT